MGSVIIKTTDNSGNIQNFMHKNDDRSTIVR